MKIQGIEIPNEFSDDGNSVPRILWPIFGNPWRKRTRKAARLHDFLYVTHLRTRKESDRLYYKQLIEDDVLGAILYYFGVRVFGWFKWW